MILNALIVTLAYYAVRLIDSFFGWQTLVRPIIVSTVTGFVLGDIKTGIIMGSSLEALYMGVSAIGGVAPADSCTSSVVAVAYTVLAGSDMATGLSLALPIGTLMASVSQLTPTISVALHPFFMKLAESGNGKKFSLYLILYQATIGNIVNCLILFGSLAFGVEGISSLLSMMPAFILQGFSAAGGMMTVVGLALLATSIWSKETFVFLFLGFILAKYVGLSSLVIAVLAFIIAYVGFFKEQRFTKLETAPRITINEEDDFYA